MFGYETTEMETVHIARYRRVLVLASAALCVALVACSGGGGSGGSGGTGSETSGSPLNAPTSIQAQTFDDGSAISANDASIDTSHASSGYVAAKGTNASRLKFQVTKGDMSYNYDLPADGSPIYCPINMGSGDYTFRVMQNTSGQNYVEIASTEETVTLDSEFSPFLQPNVFCDYSESSECVKTARSLVASAGNQGEAVRIICEYVIDNISYDKSKAESLKSATGYIPNPDETLASGTGICFDYASLGCAMLRSQGIPCQVITGYVSPNDIYHAWIMVYIDGEWKCGEFSVERNTWSRVDLTFASTSGDVSTVGDGKNYTERYTY